MTFTAKEPGQIMSQDAQGRVLVSRERQKSLIKAGTDTEGARNNGAWIEAVVEKGSAPRVSTGGLRIYFAGGAYCQISSGGEAALAAELLGRLGAKR